MKTVVIMPGGFHPFHAGHLALYDSARRVFPDAEVYVAATNDTSERPFPFAVKEKLAQLAGVSPNRFYKVKSPFRAEEITKNFDPNTDQLIFVRSEKDANKPPQAGGVKKDGSPAYLQPLIGAKRLEPFARHAYMAYLPTVEFGPGMTSATEIRSAWPALNAKRKTALVMSLYPRTKGNAKLAATVVGLLDAAIGGATVDEDLSRRGFLRGLGAAAMAGAAGSAMAQSRPVDVSQAFANMRKDDPRVQHNKDIDEMARAIYDQMVTLRGQPIDRRQQQMWMTVAREKAAEKLAKYAPGRPAAQPQSSGFPSQGSERRVSRNIDNFESHSVKENQGWAATYEQGSDYIEEKWSQKYKSSINCSNPRGFSQRAHCAGRRKNEDVAEAFGPLPKDNQQIRLGRHTVDIERVGLDNNYISFAWHDSQGQEHYEEVAVGDLGSYDDLIDRIKQEISYQERKYTDQGVAEAQLAEKCWDTHRQAGMKKKGNRMVPNCVPK